MLGQAAGPKPRSRRSGKRAAQIEAALFVVVVIAIGVLAALNQF